MRTRITFLILLLTQMLTLGATEERTRDPGEPAFTSGRANVTFQSLLVKSKVQVDELAARLGPEQFLLLEKLNRRDRKHMKKGTELFVPARTVELLDLTPFPAFLPFVSEIPKLIVVSLRVQAFAAFENGRLVHWGATSTGRVDQATPATLYSTNWRSPRRVSSINRNWIMRWYFNLHTSMGLAFHQYDMPGVPESYGCVRLLKEDAKWIFDWADASETRLEGTQPEAYGTPVVIFGDYDFDSEVPWSRLGDDPGADTVSLDELNDALAPYLAVIQARAKVETPIVSSAH